jgi:hypothetical protein
MWHRYWRSVADDGFGVGVQVVGVTVYRPLVAQVIETIFAEIFGIEVEQVTAQSVHGDLQDQTWRIGRSQLASCQNEQDNKNRDPWH